MKVRSERSQIGRPLTEWREVWENDTSKLSDLVRNLAFAGIGIIWIFKTSSSNDDAQRLQNVIPVEFIGPLLLIVLGLTMDLFQYLWRAINTWAVYKIKMSQYARKKITEEDAQHATMPVYIATTCWIIFLLKIGLIAIAYINLLFVLLPKIYY